MNNNALSQRWRLLLLSFDVAILCGVSYVIFGQIIPPNSDKGFWFYVALLGLVLGSRLDTPFFVKPVDVVLYAAPAVIALALGSHWATWGSGERVAFVLSIGFAIFAMLLAATAILTLGSRSESLKRISSVCKALAEVLGAPRTIFTVTIAFALYAYHRDSALQVGLIGAAWAFTVVLSPIEGMIVLIRKIGRILVGTRSLDSVATVAAYQTPGLILARTTNGSALRVGDLVAVNDPIGAIRVCKVLDYVGRDDGLLLRLIELTSQQVPRRLQIQLKALRPNQIAVVSESDLGTDACAHKGSKVIGIVAPETSLERLYFEVSDDSELEEGRLVEVQVGRRMTTYQVVNGLTREEIVQSKNTHGYARAQAQRIGEWDIASNRFKPSKWLPRPNASVGLKQSASFAPRPDAVGHFPGTDYPASIKSIDELVTHNTAILGILGVGKSMLSIELVERMISAGIKVICLDMTNQYAVELADYCDATHEAECMRRIEAAGLADFDAWAENPEEGGSLPGLKEAFKVDLEAFLADERRMLKIYNPTQVVGTKQTGEAKSFQAAGQWRRGAALWAVTPVEVTRIVSETALMLLQGEMSAKARLCLVYEEAHSLIPEFSSVAAPSDREATNGTARAILQGRKYGLGCLLITQRTANVTKTILNQCNTVFAMRTFDETGKEFLSNYVGRDYAGALSSISERHAVFFGKASSCENPILIRLNDRNEFRRVFGPHVRNLLGG